jgi:hypothetical protein
MRKTPIERLLEERFGTEETEENVPGRLRGLLGIDLGDGEGLTVGGLLGFAAVGGLAAWWASGQHHVSLLAVLATFVAVLGATAALLLVVFIVGTLVAGLWEWLRLYRYR